MADNPVAEAAALALLKSEGFTVTAPPAPAQPKEASLWKPRRQEFTEAEFDALAAQLPEAKIVKFTLADQIQDGVAGHVLIATQESQC